MFKHHKRPSLQETYLCVVCKQFTIDSLMLRHETTSISDKIIEAVRARPTIWDFRDKYFKNRSMRRRIWSDVALEVGKLSVITCMLCV